MSYTYDPVSDLTSVSDGVNPSGAASATISGVSYDDAYRVTAVNSAARGLRTYGYNSIGNMLTNQDFGLGGYQYGVKPHAVTSANGISYAYDACGNMTNRGNQTLVYDAQNQLIRVSTTNDTVRFGYDDNGERLWRCGTNGYTVWIGGIYEINNGKVLCHVFADGQLVATFEPQCNAGLAKVFGQKNWYAVSTTASTVVSWPFKNGRGRWTLFGGTWLAILGICMIAGRDAALSKWRCRRRPRPYSGRNALYGMRRTSGFRALWRQAITLASISAFLLAGIGNVDASPIYTPVFYFYSTDYLGSSNILTDNSGNLVQHYEYSTFGETAYQNNTSAFPVSNRYTGQIADDETGLYFYGARYYDAQLGRFIQPDTEVQAPDNPQTLNRYSYCGNNPLNCVDPSGNFFWFIVAAILIGAAAGAATSAATGGNIALGALGGALAGLTVSVGLGLIGPAITQAAGCCATEGQVIGGAIGGAVGGASSAALQGGNVGLGALIGGVSGALVGSLDDPPNGQVTVGPDPDHPGELAYAVFAYHPSSAAAASNVLSPGQASVAGGAATAAATAVGNHSIGEPSTLVSMIPGIGSGWEALHYYSSGQYVMGTVWAAMAVLDVTGVGELGDLGIKGALKLGQHIVYEGIDKAGVVRYVGITKRSLSVRAAEQLASGTGRSQLVYRQVNGATGLTRLQARIWEQKLINAYGGKGGQLLNIINSIAPKYWQLYGIMPP